MFDEVAVGSAQTLAALWVRPCTVKQSYQKMVTMSPRFPKASAMRAVIASA